MDKLHLDFETRSVLDLRKVGLFKYAQHESTEILCMGWAFDDEEPQVVAFPGDNPVIEVQRHVANGGKVIAHNAAFEIELWYRVLTVRHKWPWLKTKQTYCTMVRSYAVGLPGALEKASAAVGLETQKDMAGHRLMLKMCKPKDIFPDSIEWHETDEQMTKLMDYCKTDVVVERGVDERVPELSQKEREIWLLDQIINSRGIAVDMESVSKALRVVESEQMRLDAQMQKDSNGEVSSAKAVVQIKNFCTNNGVETGGVAKNDIIDMLARDDLPSRVRTVLLIRQEAAKSSTAKLKKMLDVANSDFRIRGMFQYHGAGTGRWAGRGVQVHNLPRPVLNLSAKSIEEIFANGFDRDYLDLVHGSPLLCISDCLRSFLWASVGDFISGDLNQIEARVICWLAGQESTLTVFREGGKVYEEAAGNIFNKFPEDIIYEERQIGKVSVLALGFQGGVGAFQSMARGYNVDVTPAGPKLWQKASLETREKVMNAWEQRGKASGIAQKTWLTSELIKVNWRAANQMIVKYWYNLENAVVCAVREPGLVITAGVIPCIFKMNGSFLQCKLPSGRIMHYPYPRISIQKTPWGQKKPMVTYKTVDTTINKFIRIALYGGLVSENITQAVARDILAEAMVKTHKKGLKIVMHVHDEILCEGGDLEELLTIMRTNPVWAKGLPIDADGWTGKRFRK